MRHLMGFTKTKSISAQLDGDVSGAIYNKPFRQ
jgi:hypothetical protein